jgi:hypothetical protein
LNLCGQRRSGKELKKKKKGNYLTSADSMLPFLFLLLKKQGKRGGIFSLGVK